ncbi:MAG: hypothetical protein KI790_07100 [Cyclobacteriaceae bacterium]|nr:hypothetical protein [Cyclobacteriaceae bacterium HetDA_MAG_MS6]
MESTKNAKINSPSTRDELRKGIARFEGKNPLVSIVVKSGDEEVNFISTLCALSSCSIPCDSELIILNNSEKSFPDEWADILGIKVVKSVSFHIQSVLSSARGVYVIMANAGKRYPENWISSMIKPLNKSGFVTIVSGAVKTGGQTIKQQMVQKVREWKNEFLQKKQFNIRRSNVAFRTEDAQQAIGYNMESTSTVNDQQVFDRLIKRGLVCYLRSESITAQPTSRLVGELVLSHVEPQEKKQRQA